MCERASSVCVCMCRRHRHRRVVAANVMVALSAVVMAAPAMAAPKAITGKLSRPGYTVIALAATGRATSVRVTSAAFALRPPAASVTLHLRAPNGRYAGPVVLVRAGSRAIVGVRAGARLGRIAIRRGYATPSRRPAKRWVDASRWARARAGVPIGAGKVGLVRVRLAKRGAPGDRDLDGIPNALDIDDDGDLILDGYDRPAHVRALASAAAAGWAAQAPDRRGEPGLMVTTMFGWTPYGGVNADGGATDVELAAAQRAGGILGLIWQGIDPGSGELDCSVLAYCSKGGTGLWAKDTGQPLPPNMDNRAGRERFPECCDADGDGLGSLMSNSADASIRGQMFLLHGASADEIHAEDVLIARGTLSGMSVQYPSSVGFVFSSQPVFAGYDDGQGNSAGFTYPPPESCRPGSTTATAQRCQASVRAGPDGQVVLDLRVWRPQRPRLPSEPGAGRWMDVGHLAYAINVQPQGAGGWCPQSTYTRTDAVLSPLPYPVTPVPAGSAFVDSSADQPAAPANTFGLTLNLTRCYEAVGMPTAQRQPLVQLVAFAIGSDYPNSGEPPTAASQTAFRLVP